MPSDRLLTAFEQLALIVGTPRALYPNDARFGDYLKDETYLTGAAELVLQPQSQKEVVAILQEVKALREKIPHEKKHLSLTLRGGGSGLSGAAVPSSGIVLDLSHLKKIFEIDEKNLIIHAECGIILAELNQALADTSFYYAVDPSSSALCTLGGSIATNAAGPSSLKYGTTRQQLASLHFLHTTGAIVQAGSIPNKTSMGFSLPDILCGSEGRLGIILDATVRLTPRAETTTLILAPFTSESDAIDFVFTLKQSGIRAKCIEFIDAYSLAVADFHSQSGALLMIELDGFEKQVALEVERLIELAPTLHFVAAQSEKDRARLWTKRKSITGALKQRFAFKLGEDI
ncbi:MAG TPA: FAD-binding oxidoreductase, partial [Turneriella sp.]|nr:FAD-binding oxidoreductase [Turneriella sp.]